MGAVLKNLVFFVLAIVALLAGKYFGAAWLDPVMGIVGAALVARWSVGLIAASARVLLDRQVEPAHLDELRAAMEDSAVDRVTDLHVWCIGHGINAAAISIVSREPKPPSHYRTLIPAKFNIVHATIEVQPFD